MIGGPAGRRCLGIVVRASVNRSDNGAFSRLPLLLLLLLLPCNALKLEEEEGLLRGCGDVSSCRPSTSSDCEDPSRDSDGLTSCTLSGLQISFETTFMEEIEEPLLEGLSLFSATTSSFGSAVG